MSKIANVSRPSDAYGTLIEPATLVIQRRLPGPVERVWKYLTDTDMRAKWLAAGDMEMRVGSSFELVWRNDELTNPPGDKPEGFGSEHRMVAEITELELLRKISFTWGSTGGVTFELEPRGNDVLLTVIHHRVTDRSTLLNVSAGWHAHLDVLVAHVNGEEPKPFWDNWASLKTDYEARTPE